jgi:hypothetical protein
MRDIMCNGYVAGGNTRYFGQLPGKAIDAAVDTTQLREHLEERLALHNDAAGEYASLLAFACPYNNMAKRDQVISITRRLLPWEVTNPNGAKMYFPGGQSSFAAYENLYGLDTVHFGEDVRAAENMEFISNGSMNNSICFVGPHRRYNPFSNQYHQLVPGQGHFGPDALPGVRTAHATCSLVPVSARTRALARAHTHTHTHTHTDNPTCAARGRTRAGVAAKRSRSNRRETRWSRSRRTRMRRCS